MKVYQCDSCKVTVTNPYGVKMKEFLVGCHFDFGGISPEYFKRKVKIHLCEECYKGLRFIAERQRSDTQCLTKVKK